MAPGTGVRAVQVEHRDVRVGVRRGDVRRTPRRHGERDHPAAAAASLGGGAGLVVAAEPVFTTRELRRVLVGDLPQRRPARQLPHIPQLDQPVRRARGDQHLTVVGERDGGDAVLYLAANAPRLVPDRGGQALLPLTYPRRKLLHGDVHELVGLRPGHRASLAPPPEPPRHPAAHSGGGLVRSLDNRGGRRGGLAVRPRRDPRRARPGPSRVPHIPHRDRAVPPAAGEDVPPVPVPAAAVRSDADGLDAAVVPAEVPEWNGRLHVPQPHGLIAGGCEQSTVAVAPRRVEYGVLVRDPLLLWAELGIDLEPREFPGGVDNGHLPFLVGDREEPLAALAPTEPGDEGRGSHARVRGHDWDDSAPRSARVVDEIRDPRSPLSVPRVPHELAAPEELVHGAPAVEGFARAGQRRDVMLPARQVVPHGLVAHQLVVVPGGAQTRSLSRIKIPS